MDLIYVYKDKLDIMETTRQPNTVYFGDKVIGTIQSIDYTVEQERVPISYQGGTGIQGFSRGRRGIAGTLVFNNLINEPNGPMDIVLGDVVLHNAEIVNYNVEYGNEVLQLEHTFIARSIERNL